MHPLDSSVSDQFSPCTIDQICSQNPVLGSCLVDSTNLKTIQSSICGNGVKEGAHIAFVITLLRILTDVAIQQTRSVTVEQRKTATRTLAVNLTPAN